MSWTTFGSPLRKRGIIQIQIEDDEGRSYDPQTFEKIHAHRT